MSGSDKEQEDPFKDSSKINRAGYSKASETEDLIKDPDYNQPKTQEAVSTSVSYFLRSSKQPVTNESFSLDTTVENVGLDEPVKPFFSSLDISISETEGLKDPLLPILPSLSKVLIPISKMASDLATERMLSAMPILDNNGSNLELFLNRANLTYAYMNDDQKKKKYFLDYVISCTSGDTHIAVRSLETFEQVQAELSSRFLPTKTISSLQAELSRIKQYPNETILSFSDRIQRIAYALDVAFKLTNSTAADATLAILSDINSKAAMNTFVSGMGGEMRNWIMSREFKTFKEAVDFAKSKEHEVHPIPMEEIPSLIKKCGKCGSPNHFTDYCRAKPNSSKDDNRNSRRKSQAITTKNLFCDYCRKPNHTEDRCYLKKREISKASCVYCGLSTHTTQNCMRKIADQPHLGNVNHVNSNAQFLAQLLPELLGNLSMRQLNNPFNLSQGNFNQGNFPQNFNQGNLPQNINQGNFPQNFNQGNFSQNFPQNFNQGNSSQGYNHFNGNQNGFAQNTFPHNNSTELVKHNGNINHYQSARPNNYAQQSSFQSFENSIPNTASFLPGRSVDNGAGEFQIIGNPNTNQNIRLYNTSSPEN